MRALCVLCSFSSLSNTLLTSNIHLADCKTRFICANTQRWIKRESETHTEKMVLHWDNFSIKDERMCGIKCIGRLWDCRLFVINTTKFRIELPKSLNTCWINKRNNVLIITLVSNRCLLSMKLLKKYFFLLLSVLNHYYLELFFFLFTILTRFRRSIVRIWNTERR